MKEVKNIIVDTLGCDADKVTAEVGGGAVLTIGGDDTIAVDPADPASALVSFLLSAEQSGKTFFEVLKTHTDAYAKITAQLEKLGVEDPQNFFANPERYHGLAAKKSKRLAQKYAELMK